MVGGSCGWLVGVGTIPYTLTAIENRDRLYRSVGNEPELSTIIMITVKNYELC